MLKNLNELKILLEVKEFEGESEWASLLLELAQGLEQRKGQKYLQENKEGLLEQWRHIYHDLL
ncbi:hypothetical protein A2Z67_04040 [Candidatus Woesebacteria bacterium RBG_13_36_22]|uniref:Uncharacterized protein n=1 Tax=Candidatus Woesebacteria bacterium RBG_13_36_22 TaxID=1802478 RepID=A0A1F7X5V9_9BACT|nr:MAG: hypothetical protein A2Z67_04040 [Candidatus Woesebacteria bacterium RBG_13_36_22]